MNKSLAIVVLIIIGIAMIGIAGSFTQKVPMEVPVETSVADPVSEPAVPEYTMTEVAMHKDRTDCWTVISGKVYNLTAWVDMHPGGSGAIAYLCGKDGTTAFSEQHGGQERPETSLSNFYIGELAKN